jgi:toxin ParE1/3/4
MRRLKVLFRSEASDDLEEIYRYVYRVSRSAAAADKFVARIRRKCRKIGNVPYGGVARDDLGPGLRTVPFESTAVIAYRIVDVVEITNVFYGGRDYESLYRGATSTEADES